MAACAGYWAFFYGPMLFHMQRNRDVFRAPRAYISVRRAKKPTVATRPDATSSSRIRPKPDTAMSIVRADSDPGPDYDAGLRAGAIDIASMETNVSSMPHF